MSFVSLVLLASEEATFGLIEGSADSDLIWDWEADQGLNFGDGWTIIRGLPPIPFDADNRVLGSLSPSRAYVDGDFNFAPETGLEFQNLGLIQLENPVITSYPYNQFVTWDPPELGLHIVLAFSGQNIALDGSLVPVTLPLLGSSDDALEFEFVSDSTSQPVGFWDVLSSTNQSVSLNGWSSPGQSLTTPTNATRSITNAQVTELASTNVVADGVSLDYDLFQRRMASEYVFYLNGEEITSEPFFPTSVDIFNLERGFERLVATNRRWCANVTNERSTPESSFLNSARLNDGALSLSTGRFNTRATHIQCCPSPTERVLVWSGGLSFETS